MAENDKTDEQLAADLSGGDMSALGELASRHQAKVLSLAYRMLNDWDQAEDLAQEAFLRVYRSVGKYHGKSKFTTWLYRVVVNLCLDQRRKRRNVVQIDDIEAVLAEARQADPLEKREIAEAVRRAVAQLNERQRMVVILHRFEGLSHGQVSELTGWSKSAVESLLVRAYEALRGELKKIENMEQ